MTQLEIHISHVKVMRSHDYCHFEVSLTSSETATPEQVDELRKTAARLADKAVEQYQTHKLAMARVAILRDKAWLKGAEETPEDQRGPQEKAIIKYHADAAFRARFDYDYQDDYDPDYDDE